MPKIINFPNGENNAEIKGEQVRVSREFCATCGNGLDLWSDDNGTAYGVCVVCDFKVGIQPIILVQDSEE